MMMNTTMKKEKKKKKGREVRGFEQRRSAMFIFKR
jgi:hypothetical protein